jgi:superfamily II DNA or RNA helicase
MNKYILSKKGCILNKNDINDSEINWIKSDLTVRASTNHIVASDHFNAYCESDTQLFIPKFYAMEKFSIPFTDTVSSGDNITTQFLIDLRPEQKVIISSILNAYEKRGGGILSLPCGFGKTIMALYFISVLKKKTLIIVHREFLLTHWSEKIKSTLENMKVGIMQGSKCWDSINSNDIVIVMLQTLALNDYPDNLFDSFGHIIIDECHRVSTSVFSNVLFKINCNYMLGLSATPNRKDGMTKVLKWHIGDIIDLNTNVNMNMNTCKSIDIKRFVLNFDMDTKLKLLGSKGKTFSNSISNILSFDIRNKLIISIVVNEYKKNNERQFLILSDRVNHLKELGALLEKYNMLSVGYILSESNGKKDVSKCTIILATYSMATEGLDIPTLNCLVMTSPKIEVEQAIGRISRLNNNSFNPLVLDFIDILPVFVSEAKKRLLLYTRKKYSIVDYVYDSNDKKFKKNSDINSDYSIYSLDCNEKIDTEYNNINAWSNSKVSNGGKVSKVINGGKGGVGENDGKDKMIDSLFNSFAGFPR